MTVTTYLSQEGFDEERRGIFFSREINTRITATMSPTLWNVTVNDFTYKDILDTDLPKVVSALHTYKDTSLVVVLYNLQRGVISRKLLGIREDI